MRNAAFFAIFLALILADLFITSTDSIRSSNGSQEIDQSNMANDELQEESNPEFQISEEDIARTKSTIQKKQSKLVVYAVVTLVVILVVITALFGLWKDPLCCAFFTLCPCCLLAYPCVHLLLKKYSEPKKIVQKDLQKYIPGAFYTDDGLLKRYKPTEEELDCLEELVEHLQNGSLN